MSETGHQPAADEAADLGTTVGCLADSGESGRRLDTAFIAPDDCQCLKE